ncbi:MAG: hypothetical protein RIF41_03080 [Polyangiaceae bacterium]
MDGRANDLTDLGSDVALGGITREQRELTDHVADALGTVTRFADAADGVGGTLRLVQRIDHPRQGIVDLVRHARRDLADRLHSVLEDARLAPTAFRSEILEARAEAIFASVSEGAGGMHPGGENAAIVSQDADLRRRGNDAVAPRALRALANPRLVVRVDPREHRLTDEGARGNAEHVGRVLVHVPEHAIEVDHHADRDVVQDLLELSSVAKLFAHHGRQVALDGHATAAPSRRLTNGTHRHLDHDLATVRPNRRDFAGPGPPFLQGSPSLRMPRREPFGTEWHRAWLPSQDLRPSATMQTLERVVHPHDPHPRIQDLDRVARLLERHDEQLVVDRRIAVRG